MGAYKMHINLYDIMTRESRKAMEIAKERSISTGKDYIVYYTNSLDCVSSPLLPKCVVENCNKVVGIARHIRSAKNINKLIFDNTMTDNGKKRVYDYIRENGINIL